MSAQKIGGNDLLSCTFLNALNQATTRRWRSFGDTTLLRIQDVCQIDFLKERKIIQFAASIHQR